MFDESVTMSAARSVVAEIRPSLAKASRRVGFLDLPPTLWRVVGILSAILSLPSYYTPSHEESELYGLTRGSGAIQLCA